MAGELSMVTEKPRVVRKNGLEAPYDLLQMCSWVIVVLLVASFCGLLFPMIPSPYNIVTLAVYLASLAVVLVSGFETGRRDPIDPYVLVPDEELDDVADLLKCSACVSRVNRLSRHCLICDKCVVDYDHHCRWLNNCIGEANYRPFICLIASTQLLVGVHMSAATVLFSVYVGQMDSLEVDLASSALELGNTAYIVLVCVNILVGLGAFSMVTHLVGFHMYLAYHGLTTYNYVMETQAAEAAKQREKDYIDETTSDSESGEIGTDEDCISPSDNEEKVDDCAVAISDEKIIDVAPDAIVGVHHEVKAPPSYSENIPGQTELGTEAPRELSGFDATARPPSVPHVLPPIRGAGKYETPDGPTAP